MSSGDDLDLIVTVRDADGCDVVDLTNATATWVLTDARGDTPRLTVTGTLSDAENGEITVALDADDTADLQGRYYHELQVQDSLGKTCTVMSGTCFISGDSA